MFTTSNGPGEKQLNPSCTMKKHSNTNAKKNNNSLEIKVMKHCNLTDREFKIADMKKLTQCQEN